jgi:Txe/YoeB family toxin of toxin-antitoxin system
VTWKLRYSRRAAKDAEKLARAGLGSQTKRLLDILIENPFRHPPPYEKLSGDLKGMYSRRINKHHRLIYEVVKKEKIVNVLSMWTHYE